MSDDKAKPRFRFGLRSLLILIAIVALALTFAPKAYDWYYSIPLSQLVDNFNAKSGDLTFGLPLTEDEVIWALEREIAKSWGQSTKQKKVFSAIVESRRLPSESCLIPETDTSSGRGGYRDNSGGYHGIWHVDLYVVTNRKKEFRVRVRDAGRSW